MERALRLATKEALEKEYESQVGDLEMLTVGERVTLNKEIEGVTKLITADKIQDFTENNITRTASFINGQSDKLLLYFPVDKWGLPKSITSEKPFTLLSEETDLSMLIEFSEGRLPIKLSQIDWVQNLGETLKISWMISLITIPVLLIVHYLLSKGGLKIRATAKLLVTLGTVAIGLGGVLVFLNRNLTRGVYFWKQATQILAGAIIPPIISEIIKLWLGIGFGLLFLGLIIIGIVTLSKKRKGNIGRSLI